jgi:predicted Zn-dependent protease
MTDATETHSTTQAVDEVKKALVAEMVKALYESRLDDAQYELNEVIKLTQRGPEDPSILVFRTLIAIQRGQPTEALCYLNNLEGVDCEDLRALCMHCCGDPLWEGIAANLAENSPKPHVREAMNRLRGVGPVVDAT